MRKFTAWMSVLILVFLAACSLPTSGGVPQGQPTDNISADEAATEVVRLLTEMPAQTIQAPSVTVPAGPVATATQAAPVPTATAVVITATAEAGSDPTATQAPVVEPTATTAPTADAVPTQTLAPTATQPPAPTFTPPANDPRQRLGAPSSTDPMDDSSTWIWPTGNDQYTGANFSSGSMAVTAFTDTDGWRMANPRGREFTNLYLEATFRTATCSGSDHYGLITRVPVISQPDQGYLFTVTCDGRYSLRRWDAKAGTNGEMLWLVRWTESAAINAGSNQTNRLGIFTVGDRLILYANGTLLTEVKDATFPQGYIGVVVGSDETEDLTVHVDEMSFWENPQP